MLAARGQVACLFSRPRAWAVTSRAVGCEGERWPQGLSVPTCMRKYMDRAA